MAYLAAALIVIWFLVTAYVATMVLRQRRLEQEVKLLEELQREREK